MDEQHPTLDGVTPTIYLTGKAGALRQLVGITISNPGQPISASVVIDTLGVIRETWLAHVPTGTSTHDAYVDEVSRPAKVSFMLKVGGSVVHQRALDWRPPKHWVVHVVQNSHHDLGYTDLASNVLRVHDRWLDEAIDFADATRDFPADAKFRLVIEQGWSLQHFLRTAPAERATRLLDLLRAGQFELNALWGNMTTEICGHESLIRALYFAQSLRREHGIPLTSAEHNDITGISWGVCQALTGAGIHFFCPGLPLYYHWGNLGLESFWDERAVFGPLFPKGSPGAFWWEAPSGRRLLFWCSNTGCGGDCRATMPGLEAKLQQLGEDGYPLDVLRWPVSGGARDNSPYIDGYTQIIREWNEQWAYPRLVCSTNAMFYADLGVRHLRGVGHLELPVHRGELPGQDYPVGATSTAAPTAVSRNNHAALLAAEKLASAASTLTDFAYPHDELAGAYDDTLAFDEHTWGHHFPAGPSAQTSQAEKAVHAYRAAALAHDVANRALARIADHIDVGAGAQPDLILLVVFNPTGAARTDVVRAPLREIDNCGSEMAAVPAGDDPRGAGYLRGVLLTDRWHLNLPADMLDGKFDLIDATNGAQVPFQLIELETGHEPVPYAAERAGIGSGSKRYGFFEAPIGLKRDVCFVATDVPALGYKAYRLVPRAATPSFKNALKAAAKTIENEYYRVVVNRADGITSIFDKAAGRELIDPQRLHPFGGLIVRDPRGNEWRTGALKVRKVAGGPVCAALEITSTAHGHPSITQTVTLYAGIRRIDFAARILKDSTPLLDAHLAFPFRASAPAFRYEGVLSVMNPIADTLPGSQSDRIAVQNWVKVSDGDGSGCFSILWSSLDAPVASFGNLWPGYVSPAHRCLVIEDEIKAHKRLAVDDLNTGWIFSDVCYNNLGTNFAVSQNGDLLFRYAITTRAGDAPDHEAAAFGWQAVTPFEAILSRGSANGGLPMEAGFASVDDERVAVLAVKQVEDGRGLIVRLWNMSDARVATTLSLHTGQIERACRTDLVEIDGDELPHDAQTARVEIGPRDIVTIRVSLGLH